MSQCPRCAMAKAPKFDDKPQSESDQCAIISVQTNRPLQCIGIEALLFTFTLHLKYLLSNGVLCLCPCAHMLCTKKILSSQTFSSWNSWKLKPLHELEKVTRLSWGLPLLFVSHLTLGQQRQKVTEECKVSESEQNQPTNQVIHA